MTRGYICWWNWGVRFSLDVASTTTPPTSWHPGCPTHRQTCLCSQTSRCRLANLKHNDPLNKDLGNDDHKQTPLQTIHMGQILFFFHSNVFSIELLKSIELSSIWLMGCPWSFVVISGIQPSTLGVDCLELIPYLWLLSLPVYPVLNWHSYGKSHFSSR